MILIISCFRGVCILLSTGCDTPQGVFFNGWESAKNRPREQELDAFRTLAEGEDGLSPFFFLRQQEKMTFGGWRNSKRDEKVSKSVLNCKNKLN